MKGSATWLLIALVSVSAVAKPNFIDYGRLKKRPKPVVTKCTVSFANDDVSFTPPHCKICKPVKPIICKDLFNEQHQGWMRVVQDDGKTKYFESGSYGRDAMGVARQDLHKLLEFPYKHWAQLANTKEAVTCKAT